MTETPARHPPVEVHSRAAQVKTHVISLSRGSGVIGAANRQLAVGAEWADTVSQQGWHRGYPTPSLDGTGLLFN